eukprot:TRINITY_DN16781_c0_g1_i1.p1 TRINITY_DN16781_c0_g1~~TRINITY_DN16781_c0_g1_i1.p1  ORF type:complete len:740 (-),score=110.14 TRINITY_DN16781_c0_g1_i1:1248-3467(-)
MEQHQNGSGGNFPPPKPSQDLLAKGISKVPSRVPASVASEPDLGTRKGLLQKGLGFFQRSSSAKALRPVFNPELLTNQKREWHYFQRRSMRDDQGKGAGSLFEHFVVVGLPPNTDVDATEAAFKAGKSWESSKRSGKAADGPPSTTFKPKVLFKYPPGKPLSLRDLPAFCFPSGVEARVVRRSPSMSDFNEIVYGQAHMKCDDQSFVFLLKVTDNVTLYGICVLVQEIVQRGPGLLSMYAADAFPPSTNKCVVSAPRCYCILTRLPFFELHFEMIHSVLAEERLDRIKLYTSIIDMPSARFDFEGEESGWVEHAIPLEAVLQVEAWAENEEEDTKQAPYLTPPRSPSPFDFGSMSFPLDATPPRPGMKDWLEEGDDQFPARSAASIKAARRDRQHRATASFGSEEDLLVATDFGAEAVRQWAEANKSGPLRLVCGYHAATVPRAGGAEFSCQPLEHQPAVTFLRKPVVVPMLGKDLNIEEGGVSTIVMDQLVAAEEAQMTAPWTITILCSLLSLKNILVLVEAALLEKQIVFVSPNLGILSALVLSVIPLIRPYVWHSLLLPILPDDMLGFLEAPVPFVVGVQHKTPEVRQRTSNLVRVNVHKNKMKLPSALPSFPKHDQLFAALEPVYTALANAASGGARQAQLHQSRPVHRVTEKQAQLATQFCSILGEVLDGFCSDLQLHSITDVRPGGERVSLLLRESYVASFPAQEQPFMKLFSETQMFSIHCDAVLSYGEVVH